MRFDVLTLFPELIESHMNFSIMKRAVDEGVIEINTVNPRDYTLDKHKRLMTLHTEAAQVWYLCHNHTSMPMRRG